MTIQTKLFDRRYSDKSPKYWTFFWMPTFLDSSLACQDIIYLLAKLRTRLLTSSNIIVLGDETACRGHLEQVLKKFSKSEHGLTSQIIENKDKQNYESIEVLVKQWC